MDLPKAWCQMILESLNRDMFPLWDAHNEAKSSRILGYELVEPYEAFGTRGKCHNDI